MIIFKVEVLEPNVHLIRGYRDEDDVRFCFVCTLHKGIDDKKWHILGAMASGVGPKSIRKVFKYLKDYPDGTYSYVSKTDFERFYKRFCKKVYFDDCCF